MDPQYTWTPTASVAGRYSLQVWARTVGTTDPNDRAVAVSDYFTIVSVFPTMVSVTADRTFPSAVGVPVTWTATSRGGTNPQYRFWLYRLSTST